MLLVMVTADRGSQTMTVSHVVVSWFTVASEWNLFRTLSILNTYLAYIYIYVCIHTHVNIYNLQLDGFRKHLFCAKDRAVHSWSR